MSQIPSEGFRRLSGLAAVLAAVAAQSFVTRGVDAEQAQAPTYGVQLLEQKRIAQELEDIEDFEDFDLAH